MVQKRSGGRKRGKRRPPKKGRSYLWIFMGLIILLAINLLFLDALIGIKLGRHFLPKSLYTPFVSLFTPLPSEKPLTSRDRGRPREPERPTVQDKQRPGHEPGVIKKRIDTVESKPRIALVIDDLGYSPELAEELFNLDFPLTVSVLPNLPYSGFVARQALLKGKEVILHLPMEPYDYPNAHVEQGTLLTSMDDKQIRSLIEKALDDLGCAVGANNHMGSKMVENEEKMCVVLEEMRSRGLFFLDSRTSPRSIVYDLALTMGVKTAKRDIFLDGQNDIGYILNQLEKAADLAQNNGCGIAIGHLQSKTIQALRSYLPQIHKKGIQLVKLSEVVE